MYCMNAATACLLILDSDSIPDNVHFASSAHLIRALTEAEIQFRLQVTIPCILQICVVQHAYTHTRTHAHTYTNYDIPCIASSQFI